MSKYRSEYKILTEDEISARLKRGEIHYSKTEYESIRSRMESHMNKYSFLNRSSASLNIKPGHHFLYEAFLDRYDQGITVTYPKLGIFLNTYPCDQTIEVEWTDHRRSWEWNFKFSEYCFIAEQKSRLDYLPLWSDDMFIYGVWDTKPSWREMKPAYEKTWHFWRDVDKLRELTIDRIIGG